MAELKSEQLCSLKQRSRDFICDWVVFDCHARNGII